MKFLFVTVFAILGYVLVEGHHATIRCPTYWTYYDGSCYRYFSFKKTWTEAENFCKFIGAPNGQGIAHLASIHSKLDQDFIHDHWSTHRDAIPNDVHYSSNREIWIGLNDLAQNLVWKWTDGTDYNYNVWLPHEPNNCCGGEGAVTFWDGPGHNSGWNDVAHDSQDKKFPFICQMRASTCQ